jgi:hypothetical protein
MFGVSYFVDMASQCDRDPACAVSAMATRFL